MKIHQAFFGDKEGSHDLLLSSLDNSKLIGHLKLNTDMPTGIDYSYLSGQKFGEYYVFIKTMQDTQASRRGMAFSHCLIISIDLLANLNNLSVIFQCFVNEPSKNLISLQSIEIDTDAPLDTNTPDILIAAINALMENTKTVIYLGYDGFEYIIMHLWYLLPLSIRVNFSFTISDSPNRVQDYHYTIVHTPESCKPKWINYPILQEYKGNIEESFVYQFLMKQKTEKFKELNEFISNNKISCSQLCVLADIVGLYELYSKNNKEPKLVKTKVLTNKINKLIPLVTEAKELKQEILQQLNNCISTASHDEFKMLRNISLSSFENGQNKIENSVNQWVKQNIKANSLLKISDIVDLITEAYCNEVTNLWWVEAIKKHIQDICSTLIKDTSIFIWNLWNQDINLVNVFYPFIDSSNEALFLSTFPQSNINIGLMDAIINFSKNKQWYSLHASAISKHLSVEDAISSQIKIDSTNLYHNLQIIIKNVDKRKFLEVSTKINNKDLHKIGGELCAKDISYLANMDIKNPNWQIIWFYSFQITKDITKGITNPKEIFYNLLDLLLDTAIPKIELINELALAKEIDHIFDYPKRREIWSVLDKTTKEILLKKSSCYLFDNFEKLSCSDIEPEFQTYLVGTFNFTKDTPSNKHRSTSDILKFLEKLNILSEDRLIEVCKISTISYFDTKYITQIIELNSWKTALDFLFDKRDSNLYISSIVDSCKSMLGWFKRLFVSNKARYVSLEDFENDINKGNISDVFKQLSKLKVDDWQLNKLEKEFIAGAKGIDLSDFSERLKAYIQNLYKKI